jgi:hypothetical protein
MAGLTLRPFILIVVKRSATGTGQLSNSLVCSEMSDGALPHAVGERPTTRVVKHKNRLNTVMSNLL